MELIQAIALLCQIGYGGISTGTQQLKCQQSYLNCVLKQNTMSQTEALQKCILEK